jgi:hypothetical protein
MPRAVARIIVSLWLLGGAMSAALAEPAQPAPGALEITLKAGEAQGAPAGEKIQLYSASKALVQPAGSSDSYCGHYLDR